MKFVISKFSSIFKLARRRWKTSIAIIFIGIFFVLWQINRANANKQELVFEPVRRDSLVKTLDISGIVDAKEKARIRFLAGGKLVYLGAQEGDWVKKWQTIASVDKKALQKQLNQDLNSYMQERWDFEDTQDQYDYNVENKTTRKSIDQEQWDLENKVLTVEIRDIAIKESSIYSPIEGVLIKSPSTVTGVQLLATDFFEVVNPKTLIFKAEVDEADIGLVDLGQQTTIELDAYDGETITTNLSYVSYSSSQSTSGTVFLVEFPLNSEDLNKYRLGMNGDAKIILEQKENVLIAPFDATISRDGKYYVKVKGEDGEPTEKEISIGLETDDYVEITSGLDEGELVLIPE